MRVTLFCLAIACCAALASANDGIWGLSAASGKGKGYGGGKKGGGGGGKKGGNGKGYGKGYNDGKGKGYSNDCYDYDDGKGYGYNSDGKGYGKGYGKKGGGKKGGNGEGYGKGKGKGKGKGACTDHPTKAPTPPPTYHPTPPPTYRPTSPPTKKPTMNRVCIEVNSLTGAVEEIPLHMTCPQPDNLVGVEPFTVCCIDKLGGASCQECENCMPNHVQPQQCCTTNSKLSEGWCIEVGVNTCYKCDDLEEGERLGDNFFCVPDGAQPPCRGEET